jgi:hypothetical protein
MATLSQQLLTSARKVVTNAEGTNPRHTRARDGGCRDDCIPCGLTALATAVTACGDGDVAGYIVAGPEGGRLVENWDAEVHPTLDAGQESLAECHAAGYTDWRLYAMTEVGTTGG